MTCTIVRDDSGKVVSIVCSAPWGIGAYRLPEDLRDEFGGMGYGFYQPANPHDFFPDHESCTEAEIGAHKEACAAWDAAQTSPSPGGEAK